VKTTRVSADFSLADIVVDPHGNSFRSLGERLAVDPEDALRRTRIGAKIVTGPGGVRRTVATTSTVADTVESAGVQLSLEGARKELEDRILSASIVPPRKGERAKLQPLLDQFFAGLEAKAGDGADVLSAYLDRSAQGLIDLITDESRAIASRVRVEQVVEPQVFAPERVGRSETSDDLDGAFSRGIGYVGWTRSVYDQAWFDSAPERAVAVMLDRSESVAFWVRLLRGDLEIAWDGGRYNPDLVCVGVDGLHWLIEVKSDKGAADSTVVEEKRVAAQRWANHVNAWPKLNGVTWRYRLARERDIFRAKGSWEALQGLGRG
jgi:type III restriction enzyme